ncbi:hypothetical protein [Desulfonatronum sp. SC1]|uniref:hypothetical protein n=1 Tax=Desulfonatronum sp. SC1 TaxID=2109626 RepID=UPI000D31E431|nr:hypothetical protein [Desulfonatronum sp. SC1]PTN36891.1 hypothetical protein C6366_08470 [Desulfonatronum sp. SC1]
MNEQDRETINRIMTEIECPKEFRCKRHDFEDLCEARDFGLDGYIKCRDDTPLDCPFALSFGHDYFCRCPLRVFLSKKLKK